MHIAPPRAGRSTDGFALEARPAYPASDWGGPSDRLAGGLAPIVEKSLGAVAKVRGPAAHGQPRG